MITDNEALAIHLELSCNQNLTLATIYCPIEKPNFSLFQTINNLSDNILKTIQNTLNLIYLNNTNTRIWTGETATPHRNTFTNHTRYKFDQTDREVFESILKEALGSEDFSGHLSNNDLDRYADFIITALHTAVDKAIPKSKSMRPESNPISNETLVLIKEKRKLRR